MSSNAKRPRRARALSPFEVVSHIGTEAASLGLGMFFYPFATGSDGSGNGYNLAIFTIEITISG